MSRTSFFLPLLTALVLQQGCSPELSALGPPAPVAIDAGGRPLSALEVGSSLSVALSGLKQRRLYDLVLRVGKGEGGSAPVGFARVSSDEQGRVAPVILWYQSGVVGCHPSDRLGPADPLPPYRFRTIAEAEEALTGKLLSVSVHLQDEAGDAGPDTTLLLPVAARRSPMVHASDETGCLRNGQPLGDSLLYVSGNHFRPGEEVEIALVADQPLWRIGDPVQDVTGPLGAAAAQRVQADDTGAFTVAVWPRDQQRRGTYDIVARPGLQAGEVAGGLRLEDLVSYAAETGFVLYDQVEIGRAPPQLLTGRMMPATRPPYLQRTRAFADEGEPVTAALSGAYLGSRLSGAPYAAFYVVNHDEAGAGGPLRDVTGGAEILPLKPGALTAPALPLWHPPLSRGGYDVVVRLVQDPAAAPEERGYAPDADLGSIGADPGFIVGGDPLKRGAFSIGRAAYSLDDFFPSLDYVDDVDLRAVVRYPALDDGDNAAVAPGPHPIFLIQHGNHCFCLTNNPSCNGALVNEFTHQSCPERLPNHLGYLDLLDALASNGIIAVSVDAYDLTGLVPDWIPQRAQLLLKHLELWAHLNDPAAFPAYPDFFGGQFRGQVDLSRISLSGHSRGGEAAVAAYKMNQNPAFHISAVSTIAPVDLYSHALPDVPFFVVLGAADGDVVDLAGVRIYDRAGNLGAMQEGSDKAGVYIYGANHDFFNRVWASQTDDASPERPDYIDPDDQARLGAAYVAAFTMRYLLGEERYDGVLSGEAIFPSTAGFKSYPMYHRRAHLTVASGGTDSGVATGGLLVESLAAASVHATRALRLGWSSPSGALTYQVPREQRDLTPFQVLSFRAALSGSSTNPVWGGQDFLVELISGGQRRALYQGSFGELPEPYPHEGLRVPHSVMTTVRVPLRAFALQQDGFSLRDVDMVRLRFPGPAQGELYFDDLEISP